MSETGILELLEARARISDVVLRYAQIIRTGDIADCLSLFTADATFEVREGTPSDPSSIQTRSKVTGHDEIFRYVSRSTTAASVCPLIHNLLIDVKGDTATSSAVMSAVMLSSGQTILGEYEDAFRSEDGVWRFCARTYTIFRPAELPPSDWLPVSRSG